MDFARLYGIALAAPVSDARLNLLGGPIVRGLLVGQYAIPANFPDPARFAIHKLIVAQERVAGFQTKVQKDVTQAMALVVEAMVEFGRFLRSTAEAGEFSACEF
jgi:hypothetical protein